MKAPLIALLVASTLAACSTPKPEVSYVNETVHVHNDPGGSIIDYMVYKVKLKDAEKVIVSGHCASACLMLTSLPNACFDKDTVLRAHGSFHPNRPLDKQDQGQLNLWDQVIKAEMHETLKDDFWSTWRHHRGKNNFVDVKASNYKKLNFCA